MNLGVSNLTQAAWGLATILEACLLVTIVARRLLRSFPAVSTYLFLDLTQVAFLVILYSKVGFASKLAWQLGWVSNGVVVASRAVAVSELCRHAVARFGGVWALVWRALVLVAGVVLIVAITLGQHSFRVVVLTFDLGIELAMAATVVSLFVFARHYDLELREPLRSLGLGFCLYSFVHVVNNLLEQHLLRGYSETWNLVVMLTFIASVAIWLKAFLRPVAAPTEKPVMLDTKVYPALMPEVNRRLAMLNEQLSNIWKAGGHRA